MNEFLASVERRAYRMAYIATGNREEALDIVQDAMFKLAQRYADRNAEEWGPLFQRILQSRIRDWYRRTRVRSVWQRFTGGEEEAGDPMDRLSGSGVEEPLKRIGEQMAIDRLDEVLRGLPLRQQQAFLLRVWEGLEKTHYSRAVHRVRELLEEHWP